jgi:hypothetical protein
MLAIVVGSTVKGVVTGLLAGLIARWRHSVPLGVGAGLAIGFALSSAAAIGQSSHYGEIVLPGMLVGALVGFVTQRYPQLATGSPPAGTVGSLLLALALPAALVASVQRSAPVDSLAPVPTRHEVGTRVRIYSDASGKMGSATRYHVPLLMLDLELAPGAVFEQIVPSCFNGFAFVVAGAATVGENQASLAMGQVGWLDRVEGEDVRTLAMRAGSQGARVLLYAGEPQGDPIVSNRPFIGDSEEDIRRLVAEYRAGGVCTHQHAGAAVAKS